MKWNADKEMYDLMMNRYREEIRQKIEYDVKNRPKRYESKH